jgi:hypothetical protein
MRIVPAERVTTKINKKRHTMKELRQNETFAQGSEKDAPSVKARSVYTIPSAILSI